MLRASYLAGTAFTKSYVGYVHAVATVSVDVTEFLMDLPILYSFRSYWKRMELPHTKSWPDLRVLPASLIRALTQLLPENSSGISET